MEVNKHSIAAWESKSALLWPASCGLCSILLDLYGWANSMYYLVVSTALRVCVCVVLWWDSLLDYIISVYWRFFSSPHSIFDVEQETYGTWLLSDRKCTLFSAFVRFLPLCASFFLRWVPFSSLSHTQLLWRQLSQLTSSEVMDRFDHLALYHHMAPALGLFAIYSVNVYKDLKTG